MRIRRAMVLVVCFAWAAASAFTASPEQPNIIFIMVDDLGKEWIGCYGAEGIETPNIDALAEGGMRFENAYSMPQCTPTRVALLTGQYPFRNGWINHWDVPRWDVGCHFDPTYYTTFARVLNAAGYATAAAGKWQISDFRKKPDIMNDHGFDEYCMWTGAESDNPASEERYWNPYIHTREGSKTYEGRFGTDVFVDFLIDFMKKNVDKPMMLYFPMALTHLPLTTTPAEPDVREPAEQHKAMVRYVDLAVGRITAALDELKLRDNTVVIFATDNGTAGGIEGTLHGRAVRGGKAQLNEAGCNTPFIVNGPGIVPSGVVTDALTDFTDMLPTFAELGGADLPKNRVVDGKSIAKVIRGEAADSDRDWILSMGFGKATQNAAGRVVPVAPYADRVVRDKRYKVWVLDGKPSRLYDLAIDPGEKRDLYDSSEDNAQAARKRLEAVVATFPSEDAAPQYDLLE